MHDTEWEELGARRLDLHGSEVVIFAGDSTLYWVDKGSVALFCVEVKDGAPAGPRRFLHRVGRGHSLVSVPSEAAAGLRFLLVPVGQASIRALSLADLWNGASSPVRAAMVDNWIDLLARLFEDLSRPKLVEKAAAGQTIELSDERAFGTEHGRVLWCRVESGVARYLDGGSVEFSADSGAFPLGADMWVTARDDTRLAVLGTAEVAEVAAVERGLAHLQTLALEHLQQIEQGETTAEIARLEERDRRAAVESDRALTNLAATLDSRIRVPGKTSDPVLAAMAAVGTELGVEVRAPAKADLPSPSANATNTPQAIARASGLRIRRVQLTGQWWKQDCGPILAFSGVVKNRPLALLAAKRGYEIFDPVDDTRTPVNGRAAAELQRGAFMLYRPFPEGKLNLKDLFKFSFGQRWADFRLVLGTGIVATLLGMVTPQATAILMDHAIPDADRRLLLELGFGLLAAAFGQSVFYLCQGFVLLRISTRSEADTQTALWDRLLRLRPSFFRRYSSGDLESRVMAVNEVGRRLSAVMLKTVFAGFLVVLNLLLLWYYSSSLVFLAVGIAAVVFAFTVVISYFIRAHLRVLLELQGTFVGTVIQLINGISKLRVARAEDRAFGHWIKRYTGMLHLRNDAQRLTDLVHLLNVAMPTVGTILLYWFSYELLLDGRRGQDGLSLGTFLAFNAAFATFLAGSVTLSGTVTSFLDALVKGRRIEPILTEDPEVDSAKPAPGRLTGRLDVTGLSFRYGGDGPKILDGIDLHIEPGEFVAIVGPSGSGKSTLLRLLLGFETPETGTIAFDGQDLANIDVLSVRRQLGVVLQNGRLDAGSIFENIACGNAITLDDAWAAAEDAGLASEVRAMPMGMQTFVSVGGGNLSGGQRQRLLITRALANRPRILLFDEATSALDNRTQATVSQSLERLRVTRIVVAHRLSTIRHADRIYVIQGGRLAQQGSFEELMASEGVFAQMMSRQLA